MIGGELTTKSATFTFQNIAAAWKVVLSAPARRADEDQSDFRTTSG